MGRKPVKDKRILVGLRLPTSLVTKLKKQENLQSLTEFRKFIEYLLNQRLK